VTVSDDEEKVRAERARAIGLFRYQSMVWRLIGTRQCSAAGASVGTTGCVGGIGASRR